jgi:adenosyl cobinamide kinase/adenosyl cobinamide phosphate guanylyltransferase
MAKQKWEIVHKNETILKAIGTFDSEKMCLVVDGEEIYLQKELKLFHDKEVKFNITLGEE